ncbi:MAG: hypothetical protein K0U93_19880 [Gammaproteobacteria bacterium]|nr:hypothetical protein [Gammaproteobacteria bacterium]
MTVADMAAIIFCTVVVLVASVGTDTVDLSNLKLGAKAVFEMHLQDDRDYDSFALGNQGLSIKAASPANQ